MLKNEANWINDRLQTWPTHEGVVLNVGSASGAFRTQVQPWIDGRVFRPARNRGVKIIHQDLFAADGVDIVGDLLSASCQARVGQLNISGIICSNVLEHVPDRRTFAATLSAILPKGGRALITVPFRFPYHPDPIDTRYRPSPSELVALFPQLHPVAAEVVSCGRLLDLVLANPSRAIRGNRGDIARGRSPRKLSDWLPFVIRPFRMSCLDLVRNS